MVFPEESQKSVSVAVVSDTHQWSGEVIKVPSADIFVHCGDMSMRGTGPEIDRAIKWIASLPHKHKIIVPGNHDFLFEQNPGEIVSMIEGTGIVVLMDAGTTVSGLRVWGSPKTKTRSRRWAFDFRDEDSWAFSGVPYGLDLLVTHSPPAGIMDNAASPNDDGTPVGSTRLLEVVKKARPRYHLFGHIHEGYGLLVTEDTVFVNASLCDENYALVNLPRLLNIPCRPAPMGPTEERNV